MMKLVRTYEMAYAAKSFDFPAQVRFQRDGRPDPKLAAAQKYRRCAKSSIRRNSRNQCSFTGGAEWRDSFRANALSEARPAPNSAASCIKCSDWYMSLAK